MSPFELGNVAVGGLVTFANQAGIQSITFDFPPELFGTTSVAVPAGSSVTFMVSDKAQPGSTYEYSVSCIPAAEAHPRIVIRSTEQ